MENKLINPIYFDNNYYYNGYIVPIEIWRPITDDIIEGIKPYYYISSLGRVYSINSNKILNETIHNGYSIVKLAAIDKKQITISVHRIVASAFIKIPDNNEVTNHLNGIKNQNYYRNLEFCTYSENSLHAFKMGLNPSIGENNVNSIISNKEVEYICYYLSIGYSHSDIVSKFLNEIRIMDRKALRKIIYRIHTKRDWNHISNNYNIPEYIVPESCVKKFTDQQVHEICNLLQNGNGNYDKILQYLGYDLLNIDKRKLDKLRSTIRCIRDGEAYSYISKKYNIDKDKLSVETFTEEQIMALRQCIKNNLDFKTSLYKLGFDIEKISHRQFVKFNCIFNKLTLEQGSTTIP